MKILQHRYALVAAAAVAVVGWGGVLVAPAGAAITPTTDPDAAYVAATTKIDISALGSGTQHSSITDGVLTVNFSSNMEKLGPVPSGLSSWSSPPFSETANPNVLFSLQNVNAMTWNLSQPVTTFGFELQTNSFSAIAITVNYRFSGALVGSITRTVPGPTGARLFAATRGSGDNPFDRVDISAAGNAAGFFVAQVRYSLVPVTIPVDIDIKPGSDPNSINLCSMGVIPVAIFGSATFDVNDINRTSLALADVGVKVAGKSGKDLCHVTDVNDDGFDDLVCQFVAVGLALSGGDTTATVVGELNDATPFEGTDSVNIVKDTCG